MQRLSKVFCSLKARGRRVERLESIGDHTGESRRAQCVGLNVGDSNVWDVGCESEFRKMRVRAGSFTVTN